MNALVTSEKRQTIRGKKLDNKLRFRVYYGQIKQWGTIESPGGKNHMT